MNNSVKYFLFLVFIFNLTLIPKFSLAEPVSVFVSIAPQKYFVERIGGEQVRVEVMVKPGESPATFNPNPKKMSRLGNAKLYFPIGVPFEKIWISRIQAIQPNLKIVPLNINYPKGKSLDIENHLGEEEDAHTWTSPQNAKKIASSIEAALSKEKPEKKSIFQQNYNALIQDLDNLDQEIHDILARRKNNSFMVFHPAWSYFAQVYGLKQISIEQKGKEPGPKSLMKIIEKGKNLKIKVIFVQKQFGLSIAQKVAKMLGATVQELDPLAENYLENMRRTAIAIAGASH